MNPRRPALRPLDPTTATALHDWLASYISQPHADLGRAGPVCPYVPTAVRRDLVVCLRWPWEPSEPDVARVAITELILGAITEFDTRAWPSEHPELRAVVVAIPDLPREHWPLLDQVQQSVKGRAVTSGLMLGPFHQDSRVPAAHNPDFHPNKAPVPLIVVRTMARHDLLFLHDRRDWFRAYQRRFADTYQDRSDASSLTELYQATAQRYEDPILPAPRTEGAAR